MTGSIENWLASKYGGDRDDDFYDRRIGEYHASMSKNCIRRNYLDYTIGSEPGSDAWPHFEMGNTLEKKKLWALEEEHGKRFVKNSVPIKIDLGDFCIVGETDPVVVDWNWEIQQLHEVKSTNGMSYVRDSPKEEHVYQTHCYMKALDLDTCIITYISKTNISDEVEHIVQFDPDIWNDITFRFTMLHRALTTDEMPPESDEDDHDYFCPFDDREMCCKNG